MTIDEKKQFMKGYKKAVAKIKALDEELYNIQLNALPSGIDYSRDKVQTTPTSDQMVNYAISVERMEELLQKTRQQAVETCTEILHVIDTTDNDIYQTILHRRYILLQTWEEIAYSMNYSTQRIYELHVDALADIIINKD